MKNFVQPGAVISVTAVAAVASGGGVLIGSLFGFATNAAAIGEPVEIAVTGVYDADKIAAQAWAQGVRVYWDAAEGKVTSTAGGNKLIGVSIEAAVNPSTTGRILLSAAFTL